MRVVAIVGQGAERDAAALMRVRRAEGFSVRGARLPARADAGLPETARNFVPAHGALWPDEAFWMEWGSGQPSTPAPPESGADLLVLAAPDAASLPFGVRDRRAALPQPEDAFGRPIAPREQGRALAIGLLGGVATNQLLAALATLGDAADRAGIAVRPVRLPLAAAGDLPGDLAGLILPGGWLIGSIPAQIAATRTALRRGLPLFGLCLGMQSMATALARDAGWPDAMPEEFAGAGERRSVVRLYAADGTPQHRVGEISFMPVPGTQLAALAPEGYRVRLNNRYALAPGLPLPDGTVLHRSPGGVVEAIELSHERFAIGVQGHPEQGCDPATARLWDAFLSAAAAHSED